MWKKSAHTLWKGYMGCSGSVGGIEGLLGAYLVHVVHEALKLIMLGLLLCVVLQLLEVTPMRVDLECQHIPEGRWTSD